MGSLGKPSGILGSQPKKRSRSKKSFKMWHQWKKSLSLRVALLALSHWGTYFGVHSSITSWERGRFPFSLKRRNQFMVWKKGPWSLQRKGMGMNQGFFRNLGTPSFVWILSHTVAICSYTSCTLNWTRIWGTKRTALVARHFLRAWKKPTRILFGFQWISSDLGTSLDASLQNLRIYHIALFFLCPATKTEISNGKWSKTNKNHNRIAIFFGGSRCIVSVSDPVLDQAPSTFHWNLRVSTPQNYHPPPRNNQPY